MPEVKKRRKPQNPTQIRYPAPLIRTLWIVRYPSLNNIGGWNYGVYEDEEMGRQVSSLDIRHDPNTVELIQVKTNLTPEDIRRRTSEFGNVHFKTNEQMWGWAKGIKE